MKQNNRNRHKQVGVSSRAGRVRPVLTCASEAHFTFRGFVGDRITANLRNWLYCAPASNPAMLEMFRDRDRLPRRDLLPWSGEFAGKYLISAVQALRITKDRRLKTMLQDFVADLAACQDKDGYLGPWPREMRLLGPGLWDLWGHYHCMLGLYLWHRQTGDRAALAACRRAADLLCRTFLDTGKRVADAGSVEMNESAIHIFALLYQETGEPRYLRLAHEIERDWQTDGSGDYVRSALAGKEFYQCPRPRWESLPSVQAIAELYSITGDQKYREAFEQIWWSIVQYDRHNTGGFSSGEQATGNPYDPRPIETCCTVAWMALTVDMLRMTGDSRGADELELATYNAVLGAQNAEGRWWTYNTPMDGERKASAHDIVFQARAGSPELNCCSVNGPRGLGVLSEWAVMTAEDGIALNYYGPSEFTVRTPSGSKLRLSQDTDYPIGGRILLTVTPESAERFALRLRIPAWSRETRVTLNGGRVPDAAPGSYLALDRRWNPGDEIRLTFDMRPRLWAGEREAEGKISVYHGPILLTYDPRFDSYDPTNLPMLDPNRPPTVPPTWTRAPTPLLMLRFATEDRRRMTLCDFASAGAAGNQYVSWLPAREVKPAPFSRDNPMRLT